MAPLRRGVLVGVALLLLAVGRSGIASWHTLHYFKTVTWEPGEQIPQDASLVYVNDRLIGRYNKEIRQCVPQSSWIKEISHDDVSFWTRSVRWGLGTIVDLMMLKNLFNQSRAIHTLQLYSGCELRGDDRTPRGFLKYGYNGRDFLNLDLATLTWTAMTAEAKTIKRKWDAEQDRGEHWAHFLTINCPEWLHTHLRYGREALLRIDPPKGHVTRKAGSDGLETLVCRLHGFYPKEIDVTWWKDGEDQKPDTLMGGVLPNSDGTYYTWFSIEVDPKERDRYRCRVEHDGLPEPLFLAWEEPDSVFKVGLIVGAVVAAVVLVGAGAIFYVKKQRGGSYQGAPTNDQESKSSGSA